MNMNDGTFKVDIGVWHHNLEGILNERRKSGWLLVQLEAMRQPDLYFTIVWYRMPEGMTMPLGIKVL